MRSLGTLRWHVADAHDPVIVHDHVADVAVERRKKCSATIGELDRERGQRRPLRPHAHDGRAAHVVPLEDLVPIRLRDPRLSDGRSAHGEACAGLELRDRGWLCDRALDV